MHEIIVPGCEQTCGFEHTSVPQRRCNTTGPQQQELNGDYSTETDRRLIAQ
eukprot:m.1448083 g.1448083  ORF g.1448083 m.1448083 type:complete len:51 (-) comp25111_c0_seq4:10-162(-)